MTKTTIVCDIDGCVADFNNAFRILLEKIGGESIPPFDHVTTPKVWEWPLEAVKSPATVREAWAHVNANPSWWKDLLPLPDVTGDTLSLLTELDRKHNIVFATARPADHPKTLHDFTQTWLGNHLNLYRPTVLLCKRPKALLAGLLDATHLIEDHRESFAGPLVVKGFLVDRPYNQGRLPLGVERVDSFHAALEAIAKEVLG